MRYHPYESCAVDEAFAYSSDRSANDLGDMAEGLIARTPYSAVHTPRGYPSVQIGKTISFLTKYPPRARHPKAIGPISCVPPSQGIVVPVI